MATGLPYSFQGMTSSASSAATSPARRKSRNLGTTFDRS